jgi:hypothetical protein
MTFGIADPLSMMICSADRVATADSSRQSKCVGRG